MALAALYNDCRIENTSLPKAHGFIVDHRVRPESTEEAEWVAEQLRSKLGIRATVIPLEWPQGFDPKVFKGFETEARNRRYQALGRACRDKNINQLLVAHHADDQAETVMMRLANNRLRSGLMAMQRKGWIPECEDIHGVYHSGGIQKPDPNLPFPVEQGGIQILRPLLQFEKARLIATCEEKGIAWAEDQTNRIQTLTSRNAIRHIYKNHKLPGALSVRSLVDVSLHMQERVKRHKDLAEELFAKCLIQLDIQTGSLVVRFPPVSDLLSRPIKTTSDKIDAKNTAYCLMERIADLVAPRTNAPLGQLAAATRRIYPELENADNEQYVGHWDEVRRKNFCVHTTWWRFWNQPTLFPEHEEHGINLALPHPREWLLSRQPLESNEMNNRANYIVYSPTPNRRNSRHEPYRLFDGRYWIRLRNFGRHDDLILRIFHKDDLRAFPRREQFRTLKKNVVLPYRYIMAAFDMMKPSDLRFTLPAVFRKNSVTGEEKLIGFPTLDVNVDGFGHGTQCEWSVRYKKIDFGNRLPSEIIVPGRSRKDIAAEEMRQKMIMRGVWKARFLEKMERKQRGEPEPDERSDVARGFKRIHVDERDGQRDSSSVDKTNRDGGVKDEKMDALASLEAESKKYGMNK
ncbi:hypothetical protein TW65_01405 [Stemphylium lycopersici]|nr:hypothetical protein TW65_01405 [Stemphylium lycopersici]